MAKRFMESIQRQIDEKRDEMLHGFGIDIGPSVFLERPTERQLQQLRSEGYTVEKVPYMHEGIQGTEYIASWEVD